MHLFEERKSEQKPEDQKQEHGWNGWEEEAEKIESGEKANETMFCIERLVSGAELEKKEPCGEKVGAGGEGVTSGAASWRRNAECTQLSLSELLK